MNVSHIISDLEEDTKKRTPQAQTLLQLGVFVSRYAASVEFWTWDFLLCFIFFFKCIFVIFLYFFQFGALYFSRNPAH